MKGGRLISAVAAIAALSMVAAWGCSKKRTIETDEGTVTFEEKGGEREITTDEGTLTMKGDKFEVKTDEGEAVVSYGTDELPKGLPDDVPIYEPSDVAMSQVLNDGKSVMLALSTKDDTSKVKEFYESRMKGDGWKIDRRVDMGPVQIFSGSKGNRKLNVTLNRDGDKTGISLTFQKE